MTQRLVDGIRLDHGYLHMEFFLGAILDTYLGRVPELGPPGVAETISRMQAVPDHLRMEVLDQAA